MSDPNPVVPPDNSAPKTGNADENNQGGPNNEAAPPPNEAAPPPINVAPAVVVAVAAAPAPALIKKILSGKSTAILLVLFTVLMVPLAMYLPGDWSYIVVVFLMILFMIVLGIRISSRPAGILINERNLMSLTRFQLVLWTVIILSAYLVAALIRIRNRNLVDALNISLDKNLWGLLGISTASLVGAPILQSSKKTQDPKVEEVTKTANKLAENPLTIAVNSQGVLYANPSIEDAALSDMFEGDEVGNTAYVDVAKVQMFFFTVVAALSYAAQLFDWIKLGNPDSLGQFPLVSSSLVAILGISHAGFLASKSTTHTPTNGT